MTGLHMHINYCKRKGKQNECKDKEDYREKDK